MQHKVVATTTTTIHRVKGHLYGFMSNDDKTIRFILSEPAQENIFGDNDNESTKDEIGILVELPLENRDMKCTFPTESPFIEWTFLVRRKGASQVYILVSIERAERLITKGLPKKEIIDYYLQGRLYRSESELRKKLKSLPQTKITLEDIDNHVPDLEFGKQLKTFVQAVFQPDEFYELLVYFSATVLYKLSQEQMKYLCNILSCCPYVFCFRTLLEKTLQLPESPFRHASAWKTMQVDIKYSLKWMESKDPCFRDFLLWKPSNTEKPSPRYNPRHPLLPYSTVIQLDDSIDKDVLHVALEQYVTLESLRYNVGTCMVFLPQLAAHTKAKQFLVENKILVELEGKQFMLEEDDHLEKMFAKTIATFAAVTCHSATWYNEQYCIQLSEWIMKDENTRNTGFFYTHSFEWSKYLAEFSRINFSCFKRRELFFSELIRREMMIEDVKKKQEQQVIIKTTFTIVVDHVHKFGTDNLFCLVWDIIDYLVKQKGMCMEGIHLRMICIGNSEDLPSHHLLAKGHLWNSLVAVFPPSPLPFKAAVSQEMINLRQSLSQNYRTGVSIKSDTDINKLAKSILQLTRELSTKTASGKKKTIKILCSGKNEQQALSETLDSSRIGDYNDNIFCVNDAVGVLEIGARGIIKKIYKLNLDGSMKELDRVTGAELHFGTYRIKICPCILSARCSCENYYSTAKYTIYHNYVDLVQRDHGTPTDYIIFYVTKNTYLAHLQSAILSCKQKFFVFILAKTAFASLYEKDNRGRIKSPPSRQSNLAACLHTELFSLK